MPPRTRANGEGSIYPYRNGGFAAYVWVTKPDGKRTRKYVYGKTREETHDKWLTLHQKAKEGPMVTKALTLGNFAAYWLSEIVKPNLSPGTYVTYEVASRLYIVPGLGKRRLDKLQLSEVQTWLNAVRQQCQCCAQGKDERRPKKRCCALGKCCRDMPSATSVAHIRRVLRTLLSQAITEGHRTTNPATNVKLPSVRSKKRRAWTSDEARQFLESARGDKDPFYAAYVLVLVLGLRKGEMLGVTWPGIDLDAAELTVDMQIQRVGKELLHRETKTPTSDDTLPLPEICAVALRERATAQNSAKKEAGEAWQPTDLVFTTRFGTPIEPRNFNRYWDRRCDLAGVRRITIRDARRTCASLLADLDVHPRVAMQILRHAQFSITMEIYTVVSSATTRAALKKLGESLDH
ncbi:tyrosine-type recombinase/integrase [Actinoplanes xinjiangensis]|uniref:Site-specific recombinase XerD n=1 Tax=Actinoplanes xinjiangensis TaxID=512350 RepID=A0A316F5X2_9ACTN|nr:site-specific integrase [Actinoplanes xinjiangensis]PWK41678.1 site-specific recombinase XerD [Actinoplanes xinjiangensis]GIF41916.1 integrase [Actinoplanes xinjiangensis]